MTIDQIIILLAGLAWPFLLQISRQWQGMDGRRLNALAVLFCFVVAAVDVYASHGGVIDWGQLLAYGAEMTAISQVVYRQVIKPADATGTAVLPITPPSG